MTLVVSGFILVVLDFAQTGRVPQPFVYDVSDTFMDWFNTAFWAHRPGAFTVWRTVYPPISFVFLKVFGFAACYAESPYAARDCDRLGLVTIGICYFACVTVSAIAFFQRDPRTALFRAISVAIGLPLLYTLERGNLILVGFIFFALGYGELVKSRLAIALNVALAINFKPYLLIPVFSHVVRREWRTLELAGLLTLFVYMVTSAIIGEGDLLTLANNITDWSTNIGSLVYEQIYFSTSYTPFLLLNSERYPTRDFVGSIFVEAVAFYVPLVIGISQILGITTLVAAWFQPEALTRTRIAAVALMLYLLTSNPGGYATLFLVFLLFLEPWKRGGQIVALTAAYAMCFPFDWNIVTFFRGENNSWLGQTPATVTVGMTIGLLLRPGLVLIAFWGLALDSLTQIVIAHRLRRPTLDPHPRRFRVDRLRGA